MEHHVNRGITEYSNGGIKFTPVPNAPEAPEGVFTAEVLHRMVGFGNLEKIRSEVVGPTGYLDDFRIQPFEEGWGTDEHGRLFVNVVDESGHKVRFFQRYVGEDFPIIRVIKEGQRSSYSSVAELHHIDTLVAIS